MLPPIRFAQISNYSRAVLTGTVFSGCYTAGISPQGGALAVYNTRLFITGGTLDGNYVEFATPEETPSRVVVVPFGAGKGGGIFAFQSGVFVQRTTACI